METLWKWFGCGCTVDIAEPSGTKRDVQQLCYVAANGDEIRLVGHIFDFSSTASDNLSYNFELPKWFLAGSFM